MPRQGIVGMFSDVSFKEDRDDVMHLPKRVLMVDFPRERIHCLFLIEF